MSNNQSQNHEHRKRKTMNDYLSVSPRFVSHWVTTGMSSRGDLFKRILESIQNDNTISEQEKIIMICELLFAPVQEMKDEVIDSASFGVKMNDAVVAVYGATVYPLLRRMGGLVNLSRYVNLSNGIILSGGTSWNTNVPADNKKLVDAEEQADIESGYLDLSTLTEEERMKRKEERLREITHARKYWNASQINGRVNEILEVIPDVFNFLYGKFRCTRKEIDDSVSEVLFSNNKMTAIDFHEPQIEGLYDYWVIFSSRKAITPELMSEFISKFCQKTPLSLSKQQKEVLREYSEGLFMLQPDEIRKKDARKIMKRIMKFCSSDEFKACGGAYHRLEYYYAVYFNENKNNGISVPGFFPTSVRKDPKFIKWLEKRIYREKHIDYIAENITEAELMEMLHEKNKPEYPEDQQGNSNIYLECNSTNSRENADETLKILQQIIAKNPGIKKLIVISDWQYLLRQVLTTKRALAEAIAKNPKLQETLGQIEIMGWPADRVPDRIAARYRDGEHLIDAGAKELDKIVKYKDVEEMLYHSKGKNGRRKKLGIYIGFSDNIGNEPGECKPIAQYISELSQNQPDTDDPDTDDIDY